MAKIGISFKNNSREKKLFDYFNNLEDKSGDIKRILQEWFDKNIKEEKHIEEINKTKNDIRNF